MGWCVWGVVGKLGEGGGEGWENGAWEGGVCGRGGGGKGGGVRR